MQPKHLHGSPNISWLQVGLMEKKSLLQRWFSPLALPKTPELLTLLNSLGFRAFFLLLRFPGVLLFSYTFIIIIIIIIQIFLYGYINCDFWIKYCCALLDFTDYVNLQIFQELHLSYYVNFHCQFPPLAGFLRTITKRTQILHSH